MLWITIMLNTHPLLTSLNEWMVFQATILHCKGFTGLETWANEINCIMNHAPGAGSIKRLTCWPAVQRATIPLPLPSHPINQHMHQINKQLQENTLSTVHIGTRQEKHLPPFPWSWIRPHTCTAWCGSSCSPWTCYERCHRCEPVDRKNDSITVVCHCAFVYFVVRTYICTVYWSYGES